MSSRMSSCTIVDAAEPANPQNREERHDANLVGRYRNSGLDIASDTFGGWIDWRLTHAYSLEHSAVTIFLFILA